MKGLGVVFTHGEGICTPRVRNKRRQPLIKCANMTSIYILFPFYALMSFLCLFMSLSFLSVNTIAKVDYSIIYLTLSYSLMNIWHLPDRVQDNSVLHFAAEQEAHASGEGDRMTLYLILLVWTKHKTQTEVATYQHNSWKKKTYSSPFKSYPFFF